MRAENVMEGLTLSLASLTKPLRCGACQLAIRSSSAWFGTRRVAFVTPRSLRQYGMDFDSRRNGSPSSLTIEGTVRQLMRESETIRPSVEGDDRAGGPDRLQMRQFAGHEVVRQDRYDRWLLV